MAELMAAIFTHAAPVDQVVDPKITARFAAFQEAVGHVAAYARVAGLARIVAAERTRKKNHRQKSGQHRGCRRTTTGHAWTLAQQGHPDESEVCRLFGVPSTTVQGKGDSVCCTARA